jgi:phosphate transport system substrate-binding protein
MKKLIEIIIISFLLIIVGCKGVNRNPFSDTPTTGKIKISVDETFKPVADAEIQVFQGIYHYAQIGAIYTGESQAFEYLLKDSVHLIIASRPLHQAEIDVFKKNNIVPRQIKIATDAIALIVNPANQDTMLSVTDVKNILTGKTSSWKQLNPKSSLDKISLIFDNKNSSTVRYALDSICGGSALSGQSYALDSNVDVVNYVARNRDALGIIGVSWISDRDDTTQLSFLNKIKVVALSEEEIVNDANSYQPYQAYVYDGTYPFRRDIYAINTEPRNGLATGFTSFLASDRGQRIILKCGILPATQPVRIVKVKNEF